MIYRELGQRVALRRSELRLSQADLAGLVGLSRGSVANVEAGRQRLPLHQVYRLLEALQLDELSALLPSPLRVSSTEGDRPVLDLGREVRDLSPAAQAQVEAIYGEYGGAKR